MQFSSSGRPQAPNDARQLKKLFYVKISSETTDKGLTSQAINIFPSNHKKSLSQNERKT